MRRPPIVAALLLSVGLGACAPATRGPTAPIATEQVPAAPALTASSARHTVLELVDAYASSSVDGGAALSGLVTGVELERWVYWLAVQDAQFPGRIEGRSDVRAVRFVGTVPVGEAPLGMGAQVMLGATVRFGFAPDEGEPFQRARILDGAVTLVSTRAGDWRVLDLTRDGVPMSDGIQLFRDELREERGVSVRLDSLFMFTPNWQFNVVVENRTDRAIRLDPGSTGLFTRTQGRGFERTEGVPSPALAEIPAGRGVQSLLAFPLQDSAEDRVLVLTFRADGRRYQLDFPLEDLVTVVPPPPPTTGSGEGSTG